MYKKPNYVGKLNICTSLMYLSKDVIYEMGVSFRTVVVLFKRKQFNVGICDKEIRDVLEFQTNLRLYDLCPTLL